jgi:hypothetical protein
MPTMLPPARFRRNARTRAVGFCCCAVALRRCRRQASRVLPLY